MNCAPAEAVGLVGYLPVLEVSETCRKLQEYKDCANHVLQECIGHVLTMLEKRSVHGFTAAKAIFRPSGCYDSGHQGKSQVFRIKS